jgi:2-polyprenyl-3-methyl-5-hydroxy-6-metoxy-1,4-benzoquinol methylase
MSEPRWDDLVAFYEAEGKIDSQARLYHRGDWVHQRLQSVVLDQVRAHAAAASTMLDAGCAEGMYMRALSRSVRIAVGLDVSHTKLARAASRAPQCAAIGFALATLERMPLAAGVFDLALCVETLEHVPDHAAAIAELSRVLSPGGVLVASVPTEKDELLGGYKLQLQWHEKSGHLHSFSREELGRLLAAAGFSVRQRIWVDMLGGRVRYAIVSCGLWRAARAAWKAWATHRAGASGSRAARGEDTAEPVTSGLWQRLDSWLTRLPGLRRWGSLGVWVCVRD